MTNQLSKEVLAKEVHQKAVGFYNVSEEYAYKFIMEVKKIRDERYYKELGYSNFDDYCMDAWGLEKTFVQERIKIVNEFQDKSGGLNHQYGHRKTLLLARMPKEERSGVIQDGIPTKTGNKTIEEATQKEIREYQQELKKTQKERDKERKERELAEEREKIAQRDAEIARNTLEDLENTKPKTIEKIVEVEKIVDNTDHNLVKELQEQVENLSGDLSLTNRKLRVKEREVNLYKGDSDEHRRMKEDISRLMQQKDEIGKQMQEAKDMGKLSARVNGILSEIAPVSYVVEDVSNEIALESLSQILENVESCVFDIRNKMRGFKLNRTRSENTTIIEADFTE